MALQVMDEKKALVAEVKAVASKAHSAVVAEYRGLTVEQMTKLRAEARSKGVYMRVVKNTLARKAIEGTDFECMKDLLTGPLVLAFSQEDPGAAARVIKDFAKANEKLVVRMAAISGQLLAAADLDRLANLPTKQQAIAMLLGVMKAPIRKFVGTLAAPHAKLVRTVDAVRAQKAAAA